MALKLMALVLALGMDTLVVSVSLGTTEPNRSTRRRLAVTFAAAEGIMPLIGLALGRALGSLMGHWTIVVGVAALFAVGAWMVFFEDDDDDDAVPPTRDDAVEAAVEARRQLHPTAGWPLVALALSVSLDELAVGFSMGLVGIPIWLTVALIAGQAMGLTYVGLSAGRWLKPYLGEWAEKAAGLVLAGLGMWILVQFVFLR